MKQTLLGGLLMLFSNVATAGDVFEIVTAQFKDNIPLQEQTEAMAMLNDVVRRFDGFKSRDYYYSAENGHWVDFVVWTDLQLAKAASEQATADPVAGAVFARLEEVSVIFSHYERMGGVKK